MALMNNSILFFEFLRMQDDSLLESGLPGLKKFKRPNLVKNIFKKGQILKNKKRPKKDNFSLKIVRITRYLSRIS